MSGEAALPSTVDLYVDNALRMSREVPSGPFSIEDLPVPNWPRGCTFGGTRHVGREQVITSPSYTNSSC